MCNVKTKSAVDVDHNTSNNSDAAIPRISELMTDCDTDKQSIIPTEASETHQMPQLTDNLQAGEEDNQQAPNTLEIDEVNGNRQSSGQDNSLLVQPSDVILSSDELLKDNIVVDKMKDDAENAKFAVEGGDDGGDMDIGVDLSLDESGVLEAESTNTSLSENNLQPESESRDAPASSAAENQSDASQTGSTEPSSTDPAGLYPVVEEGEDKHKPSGKRVTFPSDEDIVSGAVEPKDPWRHAHNVTLEEILSSYKQACQKLNCKPIPKVLKQIQELKDLTQRNECLDLKGEKLDYKACESLEEILKRVQFKVIDLEQTNLDEDGASALFDMIEYYESATHLNISFNKHIGTRGWQAAAHMMRKTSSLQYLDARNTPLLDHSAPFVARALRISGSLAVLHLENAGLSGRPLMLLATALKMNMNLRELYLADNKLNGLQDSAQLGNLLKFNYNIQILDLRNNHILDSGLAYVCEGLKEQRKGLVTLVLWNNQLTHNGMGYLAAALPCTQSLETLNLGHNSVGNEGVHKLKDGLIANRSVLRLGLASTKLSCEGAVAVAEFIAESARLLRLDLRENEIKTGGLMALSLALKVNTSLLRLDLDREPKKETVKSFIETQRALLAEIQNGCKRNFILAKEKEENEQKMRQSASMAEIATEDGTREEEEPAASEEESKAAEGKEKGDGPAAGSDGQPGGQPEAGAEASAAPADAESDSDTEDEEEEVKVVSKPSSAPLSQPASQTPPPAAPSVHSHNSSSPTASPSPTAGPSAISGITVTESPVPPGTPPSPGRCISVSSPGRGHKIFMVTRVESPPEQQQQQQVQHPLSAAAAPRQSSEKHGDANATQRASPSPQTQLTREDLKEAPSPPTDCKTEEPSSPTQSRTLKPQPAEPASTLAPEDTEPSQGTRGPTSESSPSQPTEEEEGRSEGEESGGGDEESSNHTSVSTEAAEKQPSASASPPESQMDREEKNTAEGSEDNENQAGQEEADPEAEKQEVEAVDESDPPAGGDSNGPEPASDSPDESSADEAECLAEAAEEGGVASALPNGLKPEFSLHLLDGDSPKPASCVMEHVSVSCGQDLEEMLLEASLETGRDAP